MMSLARGIFGMVRWVNLTESYWIRATTEQLLQATNALE